MFAKLYGDGANQVLVMFDEAEDGGAEIRFYVKPDEMGVCSTALKFKDTDAGWKSAKREFASMTEGAARERVKPLLDLAAFASEGS